MATHPARSAIADFLDQHTEAQHALLARLVRLPTDNPPGDCAAAAADMAVALRELGLSVEEDVVPAEALAAVGMRSCTNLIVRHRFSPDGPVIALNAHGDVVPPGQGWTTDPYGAQIIEDPEHGPVMYGRGVAVSKSDFATYTYALLALQAAHAQGLPLKGCLELHLTWDEETGGAIGPGRLLQLGLSKPDYAISAGFSYGITYAHNGCLHLEVIVRGRQAHAAMPQTGVDALEATTLILGDLYAQRAELAQRHSKTPGISSPTLNIGLIQGGINTNVVPDEVRLRIDRRVIPEESMAEVKAELQACIAAAVERCAAGIRVETQVILEALPLAPQPGSDRLIATLQSHAARELGETPAATGVPLYTDARHYSEQGIPTVLYGAGPRTLMEARGHNADENLRLRDLHRATRVIAHACADLLQG